MAELVGDDVRLEEPGILEDRDVAGEDIAHAQGGWPGETREREAAHLRAGPHALAGDRSDVARQVPVDPGGRLAAGQTMPGELLVEACRELVDLGDIRLPGHGQEVIDIGAEFPAKINAPD